MLSTPSQTNSPGQTEAASNATENVTPTDASSKATGTPRTTTFPDNALFVQTKEFVSIMSVSPASARSDGNTPPHMFSMALTPLSGNMMLADASSTYLQNFRCCNRTFDDLFQLLGHQAGGSCAGTDAGQGKLDVPSVNAGMTTYGGMFSGGAPQSATSNNMLSPLGYGFLTSEANTPNSAALGQFPPTAPAQQQQTFSTTSPFPTSTMPQQQFAFLTSVQPQQAQAPVLLATLPDGRTVLVPIGPGGQIPTVGGQLPQQTVFAQQPIYAVPAQQQQQFGGQVSNMVASEPQRSQENTATDSPRGSTRFRMPSGGSKEPATVALASHLQQQILQERRESMNPGTPPLSTRPEAKLAVPDPRRAVSPAYTSNSITPGSPASDMSGGISPGLFSSSYQEEITMQMGQKVSNSRRTSTKMTPFLAGLELNSAAAGSEEQPMDFGAQYRALGITGVPSMPVEMQAFFVRQDNAMGSNSGNGTIYAMPYTQQMGPAGIDPSKLFSTNLDGKPADAVSSGVGSPQPAAAIGSTDSPSLRGSKRKSTSSAAPIEVGSGAQQFLLREKDHVMSSPSSSPVLGGSRRDSASKPGSVDSSAPGSPTAMGTPKKKKPNGKSDGSVVATLRKTSAGGFSAALNLYSLNSGPPERVRSLTNDPRPAPPTPPRHRGSAPVLSAADSALLSKALGMSAPALELPALPALSPIQIDSLLPPMKITPARPARHDPNGKASELVAVSDYDGKSKGRRRPKKRYICTINNCGKEYKNLGGLKYHKVHFHKIPLIRRSEMSEHDKPYQCPVGGCPRGYGSAGGLKYHMSHAHTPEVAEAAMKAAAADKPTPKTGTGQSARNGRKSYFSEEFSDVEEVEEEEEDEDDEGFEEYSVDEN